MIFLPKFAEQKIVQQPPPRKKSYKLAGERNIHSVRYQPPHYVFKNHLSVAAGMAMEDTARLKYLILCTIYRTKAYISD